MPSDKRVQNREPEESPAAHVVASNDNLLTELLLRLPVKSLLKFRGVCKGWLSRISDPQFARRKYLQSNAISGLYLHCHPRGYNETGSYYEFLPLDDASLTGATFKCFKFPGCPHGTHILQSCNGLFSCCSRGGDGECFVYNPTTNQFKTLPPVEPWILGLDLVFDPSKSHFYQVVCVLSPKSSYGGCQILIYSSQTGRWRVSGAPFTAPPSIDFATGVYWNGAIHWPSDTDDSVYFDLNDELVREMPMPPFDVSNDELVRYLGQSRGHLYLVDLFIYEDLTTPFNVYEMERDRSGWFVKFRVDPDGFVPFTSPNGRISVVSVVRGEKEEDSFLVVYLFNGKVILYNFIRKTLLEICVSDASNPYVWNAFEYTESLFLV